MLKYEQKVLEGPRTVAVKIKIDGDGGATKEIVCELEAQGARELARDLALQIALIGDEQLLPTVQIGRDFLRVERKVAAFMVRALTIAAQALEELNEAERIARDSAILARAGAPFMLSDRADIQQEARKLAGWDSDLRRFMPGGVRSQEVFGLPKIIVSPPRKPKKEMP